MKARAAALVIASLVVLSPLAAFTPPSAMAGAPGPEDSATPPPLPGDPARLPAKVRAHALLDGAEKPAAPAAPAPRAGSWPMPHARQDDCGSGRDTGRDSYTVPIPSSAPIQLPVDCEGWGDSETDASDEYTFTLAGQRTLGLSLRVPSGAVFSVCLWTTDDGGASECGSTYASDTATVYVDQPPEGTWRLTVWAQEGAGTYVLHVEAPDATPFPDCGFSEDAPDSDANAPTLSWPVSCAASLGAPDTMDQYLVSVPDGGAATVSIQPGAFVDDDLCVTAATRPTWPHDCSLNPAGQLDRVYLDRADAYRLEVNAFRGRGAYQLSVQAAAVQDDCGTGRDAGSQYRAALVEQPLACRATLDVPAGDRFDLYRVNLTEPGGLRATALPDAAADLDVCLYPPGWRLPIACGFSDEPGVLETATFMTTWTGAWLVGVYSSDESRANYEFAVTTFEPAPQDDCDSAGDASDTFVASAILSTSVDCRGELVAAEGDWRDTYRIPSAPGVLHVRVTFDAPIDAQLCTSYWWSPSDCAFAHNGTIAWDYPVKRHWDVGFMLEREAEGAAYRLEVTWTPPHDDCGTGGDAADWYAPASPLALPVTRCEGEIEARYDQVDRYTFHVAEGQTLLIGFEPLWPEERASGYVLELDAPSTEKVCCHQPIFGVMPFVFRHTANETGDHVLEIRVRETPEGPALYRLSVHVV